MAVLADKCRDVEVTVCDLNEARVAAWNSNSLPVYEPGLEEIVFDRRGKNLFFTTDLQRTIETCDVIFISVNTPTKTSGFGAGQAADLSYYESAARSIAKHSRSSKIIIEKSTVPVRTAAMLTVILATSTANVDFVVLNSPEFLAEGTAIRDLEFPDRVLIGGPDDDPKGQEAIAAVKSLYSRWVPSERILTTNLWSSEMAKLVANSFLGQRISSINSISALCEVVGADVREVAKSIGADHRIGSAFLNASVGFGGSCFQKDICNLVYICRSLNLPEVAAYWEQVIEINNWQKRRFSRNIIKTLFGTVTLKEICVLGFAFKKDTSDVRETPAIDVCAHLMKDGAIVNVYDPKVTREAAIIEFEYHGYSFNWDRQLIFHDKPSDAIRGTHAIVVVTEWDEFNGYDYSAAFESMSHPAFIFDGRNILDHEALFKIGFEVFGVGVRQWRYNEVEKQSGVCSLSG
ncbi:MAG: hypothetical protein KVP17_001992 [Porospora cf. gigantea B]|uniref:uncharacterized protein n=1 Tax=Porospora cf. gigantea B TaxID=2853592 RepID=UPI003571E5DA|nr:MAG: hypothetical protein KVP17_001992 [Porospora cf. gigantea B]